MTKRMMTRAAIAAALLCGAPAVAANGPAMTASVALTQAGFEPGVEAFHSARGDRPMWLADGTAVETLISTLRRAPLDGFAAGPALADAAQAAMVEARSGDRVAQARAERLMSTAWVRYVRALRTAPAGMTFADRSLYPAQRDPLAVLGEAAGAPLLAGHVQRISSVNPIYAQLRDAAWQSAMATGAGPDRRALINLERARFLPTSGRYIIVDAASAQLAMIENGAIVDTMKVIVGKSSSQTPMVASRIHYATLNPYWNVPTDLARTLIAPRVLADGMGYLKARGYEVLSGYEENAVIVDPASVDWKAVADGSIQVRVRQRPGATNSMGKVKFPFQNDGGIYLHDTPNKELFTQASRDVSNGCIRLEDSDRLAAWLLGRSPSASSQQPEQHVSIPGGVPVYVTYLTARADQGQLSFVKDVYGRDRSSAGRVAASAW